MLHFTPAMTNLSKYTALLLGGALAIAGCGGKAKPTAETTTHTESTTETDSGETKKSDVTEVKTQQPDGTSTEKSTVTTEHTSPPPPPAPIK